MFQVEVLLFYRLLLLPCCISGKINIAITANNLPEDRFSLTLIFPYKERLVCFDFLLENTGQRKLVFWHILRSVYYEKHFLPNWFRETMCTNNDNFGLLSDLCL